MEKENKLAKEILDISFQIHKTTGPGMFESVYANLLCFELSKRGFSYTREQVIPLVYEEIRLEQAFKADVIVENLVLIEIKSIDELAPVHLKQVITYLRLTNLKLGLLINFNAPLLKEGIRRVINT